MKVCTPAAIAPFPFFLHMPNLVSFGDVRLHPPSGYTLLAAAPTAAPKSRDVSSLTYFSILKQMFGLADTGADMCHLCHPGATQAEAFGSILAITLQLPCNSLEAALPPVSRRMQKAGEAPLSGRISQRSVWK